MRLLHDLKQQIKVINTLLFCTLCPQSDDPHRRPVPRGGLGALPQVLREGVMDTLPPELLLQPVQRAPVSPLLLLHQFVFRTEPYTGNNSRTVHEELAKAMTAILKPSTDFLTSNKLLKVSAEPVYDDGRSNVDFFFSSSDYCPSAPQYSWYFFEALVKSMAQYLIESCKVKVSVSCRQLVPECDGFLGQLQHHQQTKIQSVDSSENSGHNLRKNIIKNAMKPSKVE